MAFRRNLRMETTPRSNVEAYIKRQTQREFDKDNYPERISGERSLGLDKKRSSTASVGLQSTRGSRLRVLFPPPTSERWKVLRRLRVKDERELREETIRTITRESLRCDRPKY